MGQLLGKVFVKVGGTLLRSETGAKIDLGGDTRKAILGSSGVLGYAASPKEATVECDIALAAGDSLQQLRDATDVTVTFEADTGQVFVIRNAFLTDPPMVTEGDGGKIPIKFAGTAAEEQL